MQTSRIVYGIVKRMHETRREMSALFGTDSFIQFEVQDYSVETVLRDDVDIDALNEDFLMSDVIQIQVENAIDLSLDSNFIRLDIYDYD